MNQITKNYIPREKYINKIQTFIDKDIIKVLVVQRRVGKSYLMVQIIDFLQKKYKNPTIIYINKELNPFDEIRNNQHLYDYVKAKPVKNKTNYLFIAEI